jgi:hypothetical protein
MSKSVTAHSPAINVGTPPRNLRSLVAVLLVALASLGATIGYIAIDDSGTTTTTTVANGQTSPTLDDPFQARTQPAPPQSGPSESAIAASISQSGSRTYPTLNDPFQAQVEQPRPVGGPDESAVASAISPQPSVTGPDESAIAAAVGNQSETGPQARFQAYQDKLDSMSAQQKADAFTR